MWIQLYTYLFFTYYFNRFYFIFFKWRQYIADYPFLLTAFFRFVGTVGALDVSVASLISADAISVGALELVPRAS